MREKKKKKVFFFQQLGKNASELICSPSRQTFLPAPNNPTEAGLDLGRRDQASALKQAKILVVRKPTLWEQETDLDKSRKSGKCRALAGWPKFS